MKFVVIMYLHPSKERAFFAAKDGIEITAEAAVVTRIVEAESYWAAVEAAAPGTVDCYKVEVLKIFDGTPRK